MDAAAQLGAVVRVAFDLVDEGLSFEAALAEAKRRIAFDLVDADELDSPEINRRRSA